MKQAFPAVALLTLLVGLFVEQSLWGETMNQKPEEMQAATWGPCEGCQKTEFLVPVDGFGNLCMGCECGLICDEIQSTMKAG